MKEEKEMDLKLHSPASHSLVECLKELKFGRPSVEQFLLDDFCNIIKERLGNDGPGFSPEIVRMVFEKGLSKDKFEEIIGEI